MAVQNNTKQSLAQRWEDYQPSKSTLGWACAVTAVATMIIGFSWGGWVTGGTSQTMAATAKLIELNAITDTYKRRQFVETGGWATMPGQKSADRRAAEGCAVALAA